MVLRRVVFLPAALGQVAGLGVALAFLLGSLLPWAHDHWLLSPELGATALSLFAALALGWLPEPRRISREAITGIAFIVASALVILVGSVVPQESHDIKDILFGNAVIVARPQMWWAVGVSAAVLALHVALRAPFLLVSFDRETARAHGVPAGLIDALLFVSLGLIAAQATRTIGALPVFAFTVLPAAAALHLSERIGVVLPVAAAIGGGSAFVGYWVSFVASLPTGSCMAATAGAAWLLCAVLGWLLGRARPPAHAVARRATVGQGVTCCAQAAEADAGATEQP